MTRADWKELRLGDLVRVLDFRGRTPLKLGMQWGGGTIPALSAVNVRDGYLDLTRTPHFGSDALYGKWMTQGHAERGDILITTEAPLGNIAQIPDDHRYILSQRVILLKPHHDLVDSNFLALQMRGARFQSMLDENRSGTTATGIRQSRLVELPVQVPPLTEQRRIVAKLEALQSRSRRAREALDAVLPLLEKLRQSILAAAFRGDLTADWRAQNPNTEPASAHLARIRIERRKTHELARSAKLKVKTPDVVRDDPNAGAPSIVDRAELGQLPESWTWTTLGEAFDVSVGGTPSRSEPAYWGGDVPWVSSGEVAFCRILQTREAITAAGLQGSAAKMHPAGTVLLGMIGEGKTRGQAAILDIAACTNQNVAAIRVSATAVPPEYVFRYLELEYDRTRNAGSGNNQPALNKARVEAIRFPLAPLGEQLEIRRRVDELMAHADALVGTLLASSSAQAALERAILAKAFRGELVPQDPNDEPADIALSRVGTAPAASARSRARRAKAAE